MQLGMNGPGLARHLALAILLTLFFAGCTGATASPSGSGPGAATVQANALGISDMEGSFATRVTVPAGGSSDVLLSFEGSNRANIGVSTPDSSIGATFGSTTLSGLAGGGSIAAKLTNPVDGPLHITNSGSQAQTVGVLLMIETGRTLVVTTSSMNVPNGTPVGLDVTLTQPVAGDVVQAELVDMAGNSRPITLTPSGSGHWTGQVTPTVGGTNTINAWTTGNGIRRTQAFLNVSSGTVSVGTSFSERLVDANGDGLAEQLILTLPITVRDAGSYLIRARLIDSTGTQVALNSSPTTGHSSNDLISGVQAIDIAFPGSKIYDSSRNGPYDFIILQVLSRPGTTDEALEICTTDLGATQPYDYHAFAH